MKFTIYDWAGESADKLRKLGCGHDQEIEGDPHEAAKRLFEAGLNVMLCHDSNAETILFVDTKRFQHR